MVLKIRGKIQGRLFHCTIFLHRHFSVRMDNAYFGLSAILTRITLEKKYTDMVLGLC